MFPRWHNGAHLDVLAEPLAAVTVADHTVSCSAPSTGAVQDPRVSQVRPFAEVSTNRLLNVDKGSSRETNIIKGEREEDAIKCNLRPLNPLWVILITA